VTHQAGTFILKWPLLLFPKGHEERRYIGGGTLGLSSKTRRFRMGDLSSEEREYDGGARGDPGLAEPSRFGDGDGPVEP
jgi:hypothetical protein